ncbi:hypothetical protein Lser_V15G04133 [Lactuca serriola]
MGSNDAHSSTHVCPPTSLSHTTADVAPYHHRRCTILQPSLLTPPSATPQ